MPTANDDMSQPITFDILLELTNGTDLSAPDSAHIVWSEKDLHKIAGAIASARLLAKVTDESPLIVETRIECPGVVTYYADEEGTEEWDAGDGDLDFTPSSEWLSVTPGLPGQASLRLEVWERHADGDVSAIADLKDLGISDIVEGFVLKAYERMGLARENWPQEDESSAMPVERPRQR